MLLSYRPGIKTAETSQSSINLTKKNNQYEYLNTTIVEEIKKLYGERQVCTLFWCFTTTSELNQLVFKNEKELEVLFLNQRDQSLHFCELVSCRVYFQMRLLSYYRVSLFSVLMMLMILRAVQVELNIRLRGSSVNSQWPALPLVSPPGPQWDHCDVRQPKWRTEPLRVGAAWGENSPSGGQAGALPGEHRHQPPHRRVLRPRELCGQGSSPVRWGSLQLSLSLIFVLCSVKPGHSRWENILEWRLFSSWAEIRTRTPM